MIPPTELRQRLHDYIHGSDHADLQIYRRDVLDPMFFETWSWRIGYFCDIAGFKNKRILEAGCGFGWDAVGLALIGENEVVASDILVSMVDGMSQCLKAAEDAGVALPVTPLHADICKLHMPDGSFDGIFSSEAIEHVHDLGTMFANCFRLLRPGGTLLLVNDSNRYNEAARRHSIDAWTDRDESWEHADWLRTEVRPVEHQDTRPYAVMREEMIREATPQLSQTDIDRLKHSTAGMIRHEIVAAAERFARDGTLPVRPQFSWCRNPETGEYSERLLDPFELRRMLWLQGFEVQLRHMFRKLPYRLLNGIGIAAINKRLFRLRPHFVLVARKPCISNRPS